MEAEKFRISQSTRRGQKVSKYSSLSHIGQYLIEIHLAGFWNHTYQNPVANPSLCDVYSYILKVRQIEIEKRTGAPRIQEKPDGTNIGDRR